MSGHGLAQKDHEADRWIAATAIWLKVPLVAHDAIFKKRRRTGTLDAALNRSIGRRHQREHGEGVSTSSVARTFASGS
jgi:hypothetical protein